MVLFILVFLISMSIIIMVQFLFNKIDETNGVDDNDVLGDDFSVKVSLCGTCFKEGGTVMSFFKYNNTHS